MSDKIQLISITLVLIKIPQVHKQFFKMIRFRQSFIRVVW